MDKEIKQLLLDIEARMNERFDQMDKRFEQIDARFDQVDEKLDNMQSQLNTLEQSVIDLGYMQKLSSIDMELLKEKTIKHEFDINRLNKMMKI